MDRFFRSVAFASCGLGLLVTGSGCRMTRPEVPPGRSYSSDGRQRPAIGFSSDAHPVDGAAMTNMVPDSAGASKLASGVPVGAANRPDMSPLLGGGSGQFGPPGTSGRTEGADGEVAASAGRSSQVGDEAVLPAGSPNLPRPSIDPEPRPSAGPSDAAPITLPPDAAPRPEAAAPPSQTIQPDPDTSGRMGATNSFPSPN